MGRYLRIEITKVKVKKFKDTQKGIQKLEWCSKLVNLSFIIAFDIPSQLKSFKLNVNRRLKRMKAEMIQRSLWKHENLEELIRIATLIKNVGGKAVIMEEKFIFE